MFFFYRYRHTFWNSIVWDQSAQELHLDFDPEKVTTDDVAKTLAAVGHDAGSFKADQAVYDALPACCWYRE